MQNKSREQSLWGLSSKIDSRIWVNFTRNGLRLGSRHQEPPHTDVSRNLATVVIRVILPEQRRRRTGLLLSGPTSSFQMRASFVFNLETKVLESGWRVEKLIAQVAWSPVLSFHNLWWFGVQCHLLVLVHCVFENQRHCTRLPRNVSALHVTFRWPDFLRCWFNFPAGFGTCPHCQKHRKIIMVLVCLTGQQTHQTCYCQEENEKQETKKCKWPEECKWGGFHTTSAVPQTDHLHATPNYGSN